MKKRCLFSLVLSLILAALCLSSALAGSASAISFAETSIELAKGARIALSPELSSELPANQKLKWSSADEKVAQVSATGVVTGVDPGTTEILCEAADDSSISATVSVTVFLPVQNLKLAQPQMTAFVGKTSAPIEFTVLPANAAYQAVTWSSSDESIATVNEKGEITGLAPGTVKITATSAEPVAGNAKPKFITCNVKVLQAVEQIIPDPTAVELARGKNIRITPTVLPENASDKKVKWTSADQSIAKVSAAGDITGTGVGTTTITCEAQDESGAAAAINVTVFQPVQGIKLDKTQASAFVGKTVTPVVATIMPEDAKYQSMTWSSSDETIATVNNKGEITGLAPGKVQIKVVSDEPTDAKVAPKSASFWVNVIQAVEEIRVEVDSSKTKRNKLVVIVTVLPENATNKKVIWTTSDKKIATVTNSNTGAVIKPKKKANGTATITVSSTDGSGVGTTFDVSVHAWATGIFVDGYMLAGRTGTDIDIVPDSMRSVTIE